MTKALIKLGDNTEIKDCLIVGLDSNIDTCIEVSGVGNGDVVERCILINSYRDSIFLRLYMWWNHTRKKWR